MFDNYPQGLNTPQESTENLFELVNDEERKKFVCKHPGCGKFFRYKSEIVRHTATHSDSRPFVCHHDNCFKAFKRNDALENHIRSSHTKETPFLCPFPECGMKFTTHGSFRYHVLKHNKQLPPGADEQKVVEKTQNDPQPQKHAKIEQPVIDNGTPQLQEVYYPVINDKRKIKNEHDEYYQPAPRFAGKIQWEMVDDDAESSLPIQKQDMVSKETYDSVVEENQALKQKLATSDKVIKTMQKQMGELLNNLYICQNQLANAQKPFPVTTLPSSSNSDKLSRTNSADKSLRQEDNFFGMMNFPEDDNLFRGSLRSPGIATFSQDQPSFDGFLNFGQDLDSFHF